MTPPQTSYLQDFVNGPASSPRHIVPEDDFTTSQKVECSWTTTEYYPVETDTEHNDLLID